MIFGHIITVGRNQIVHHFFDGVNIQLAGGVRIHHSRLINMFQLVCARCLNGQQLYVDIGHIHSRALDRQRTHIAGMDSLPIDKARNLHTGLGGKVGDQMVGI